MYYLENLKDLLCEELEDIASKGELTAGSLETIHKLTDTVKNIEKIEMYSENDGYSRDDYMPDGRDYGASYRQGRGTYAKRDSKGRYSRGGYRDRRYSRDDARDYMLEQLNDLMSKAETQQEKDAIRRCVETIERV